jgi:hypothetical protein
VAVAAALTMAAAAPAEGAAVAVAAALTMAAAAKPRYKQFLPHPRY